MVLVRNGCKAQCILSEGILRTNNVFFVSYSCWKKRIGREKVGGKEWIITRIDSECNVFLFWFGTRSERDLIRHVTDDRRVVRTVDSFKIYRHELFLSVCLCGKCVRKCCTRKRICIESERIRRWLSMRWRVWFWWSSLLWLMFPTNLATRRIFDLKKDLWMPLKAFVK